MMKTLGESPRRSASAEPVQRPLPGRRVPEAADAERWQYRLLLLAVGQDVGQGPKSLEPQDVVQPLLELLPQLR